MARFELIIRTPPTPTDPATAFRSAPSAPTAGPAAPTPGAFRPAASGVRWGPIVAVGLAILIVAAIVNSMSHSTPAATSPYGNYSADTGSSQYASTQAPAAQNANPVSTQVTPALVVTKGLGYVGDTGTGGIEVDVVTPGGVSDRYVVEADSVKSDVNGHSVPGDRADSSQTDNTGGALMSVSPGHYIVLADLPGANWGEETAADGEVIDVTTGQTTRLTITLGKITFEAKTVDKALQFQNAYLYFPTPNVAGREVKGKSIDSSSTDNTGSTTFTVTPGTYALASQFAGYNWGSLYDDMGSAQVAVTAGQNTVVIPAQGRLHIGAPAWTNAYVKLAQDDPNSSATAGHSVASESTGSTGFADIDLTPGTYTVEMNNQSYTVTITDGQTTNLSA